MEVTRTWQLTANEAMKVKHFMHDLALKLQLEIIDKDKSEKLGFEDELLDDCEIMISKEEYPKGSTNKWRYGGIELTESIKYPYSIFSWGLKDNDPEMKILQKAVNFAKSLTGRDISIDVF